MPKGVRDSLSEVAFSHDCRQALSLMSNVSGLGTVIQLSSNRPRAPFGTATRRFYRLTSTRQTAGQPGAARRITSSSSLRERAPEDRETGVSPRKSP